MPFWNKFKAEIDATDLARISHISLDTEGYKRAKNILKGEYGKTSEIVNAYVQNILGFPTVASADPNKVDTFYKTLLYNVQSLETLGKIERVNGMMRSILDKLSEMKANLVRGQTDWQDWDFPRLVRAIKEWRGISPVSKESSKLRKAPMAKRPETKSRLYHTEARNQRLCVYCDDANHALRECMCGTTLDDHAADCKSKMRCQKCWGKHHTSICNHGGHLLTATGQKRSVV